MDQDPPDRKRVLVAIGAVVENVSSLDEHEPARQHARDGARPESDQLRVLITLREDARVLGGLWELPGGKVEAGEDPADAVVRELYEEVGINVEPIEALPHIDHDYEHAHIRLLPYICRRVSGIPRPLEVADVRWVQASALSGYDFPEASLPVFASLRNRLQTMPDGPPTAGTMGSHSG